MQREQMRDVPVARDRARRSPPAIPAIWPYLPIFSGGSLARAPISRWPELGIDAEDLARLDHPAEERVRDLGVHRRTHVRRRALVPSGSLYRFSGESDGPVTRWPSRSGTM